jgi:hypothetical protein
MVWQQADEDKGFAVALEADVPPSLGSASNGYNRLRYEVGIGLSSDGSVTVSGENLWMIDSAQADGADLSQPPQERSLFPLETDDRQTILQRPGSRTPRGRRLVVRKVAEGGNDYFRSERTDWNITFRLAPRRLALSGVPEVRAGSR